MVATLVTVALSVLPRSLGVHLPVMRRTQCGASVCAVQARRCLHVRDIFPSELCWRHHHHTGHLGTGDEGCFFQPLSDRFSKLVSNWNPAFSTKQQGRPAKRWEDDLKINSQPDRSNRNNSDLTRDMTWVTTAEDSSKWDAMESDFISSRLKQPARPTTPITTTATTQPKTTKQQELLRLTAKAKTTLKTTTMSKTTKIRYLSSLNKSTVESPLHQSNHIKYTRPKNSNFLMTHSHCVNHISFPVQMHDTSS